MQPSQEPRLRYYDWIALRTHLLWCYDHEVTSARESSISYSSPDTTHGGAWLVRKGWAEVESHGVCRADPGQWLIPRPAPRVQRFAAGTHLLSIAFDSVWPDGSCWLEDGLPIVLDAASHPRLEKQGVRLARAVGSKPDEWDAREKSFTYPQLLRLDRYLNDWLGSLLPILMSKGVRPSSRGDWDERVMEAIRLLDGHPLAVPLDPTALAAQVGLSLSHLNRLFGEQVKSTPRHYFEDRRFRFARDRLCMGGTRVTEVAGELGFRHLSHFSRWFRRRAGRSPRSYAAWHRSP